MGAPKLKKEAFNKIKLNQEKAKKEAEQQKKQVELLKKKLNSMVDCPENAKKAAKILEHLINSKK